MTHKEAIGIKIYHEAMEYSYQNNVELRPSCKGLVKYYANSKLTMKVHDYLFDFIYFDGSDTENEIKKQAYIKIIADYLTKLDDVYTGKATLEQ